MFKNSTSKYKKVIIVLGILVVSLVIFILIFGFPLNFNDKKLNVSDICNDEDYYRVGQCPNGDYMVGDNNVYDSEGRYLMFYGSRGKFLTVRGWIREKFIKEEVGCTFGNTEEVCEGQLVID
jgi:hypothetical protein